MRPPGPPLPLPPMTSRPGHVIDAASTVLVTGGAGFIGSHLVEALVPRVEGGVGVDNFTNGTPSRVERVVVLDNFTTGTRSNFDGEWADGRVEIIEGSTTDADLVDRLVGEADLCFHLASAVGVQLVVSNPLDSLLSNTRGTDNVMGAAARHGTRLLFTSTSEVYGKNSSGALDEHSDRVLGSPFKARW